jgi:cytidine deaminase
MSSSISAELKELRQLSQTLQSRINTLEASTSSTEVSIPNTTPKASSITVASPPPPTSISVPVPGSSGRGSSSRPSSSSASKTTQSVTPTSPALRGDAKDGEFHSILVHNVSHSDVLVSLRGHSDHIELSDVIAKPKFSQVFFVFEQLYRCWKNSADAALAAAQPSHTIVESQSELQLSHEKPSEPPLSTPHQHMFSLSQYTSSEVPHAPRPVGYQISPPLEFKRWSRFRMKSGHEDRIKDTTPCATGVYFPLMAAIMPKWVDRCNQKYLHLKHAKYRTRTVYLVSGSATPWNIEHDERDNSTLGAAKLMKRFIETCWPGVKVVIVHSDHEVFHYDSNVRFIKEVLRPHIEQTRRILAARYLDKWPKHMHVTLSLSAGASARIAAINASLRDFRPDSVHMWQLKTFWHSFPASSSINDNDVELHKFHKLEMSPAIPIAELDPDSRALVAKMLQHKSNFEAVRDAADDTHELRRFWLRKSHKPVLSVLMVQKDDSDEPQFYFGVNSEVSLPTGTLCAERNAIGSALASDPTLMRSHIRSVCNLSLRLDRPDQPTSTSTVGSPTSSAATDHVRSSPWKTMTPPDFTPDSSPLRLPPSLSLLQRQDSNVRTWQDRAVIRQSSSASGYREDANPIAPCGACNEWLKKIAEVNPDFKILTFASEACEQVYINSVRP